MISAISCVEPFQPDIEEEEGMLVVNGRITDRPGEHFVEISRSSPLEDPGFIPVNGCVVRVEDNSGMVATYTEDSPGLYKADLDDDFLGLNRVYRLLIDTPDGSQYESSYDSLLAVPELENLYFKVDSQMTADRDRVYYGVQFYVDVKGEKGDSRNVMWQLEETFEYRSRYLIGYIWDGVVLKEYYPATDSLYVCFKTQDIPEIYAASSGHLISNELRKYPLKFVSDQSPRLKYKYSLLVSQHSLSEDAFRFWEQTRIQLTETGSFYETQPSTVTGNICNIHDETEQVLGYFYASQVEEKRLTLKYRFHVRTPGHSCALDTINSVDELGDRYPYYMYSLSPMGFGPPYGTADPACFNCELRGGTIVPPDYWYEDD